MRRRHLLRRCGFVAALLSTAGACRIRYETLELGAGVGGSNGGTAEGGALAGGGGNAGNLPAMTGGSGGAIDDSAGSEGLGAAGAAGDGVTLGGEGGAGGAADLPAASELPCGDRCVGGNCYRPSSALHLATTDASVALPDARVLDLGKQFTIEFWLCVVSYANAGSMVLNKFTVGVEDKLFRLPGNGLMSTRFFYGPQAPDQLAADATTAIPAGQWTHVATSYAANQVQLFINGVPVASASSTTPISNGTGPIYLGQATRTSSKLAGANVILADVRWSASSRYSAAFSPEPQLTLDAATRALWRLEDGAGTTVADAGPSGLNGTVTGGAVWLVP